MKVTIGGITLFGKGTFEDPSGLYLSKLTDWYSLPGSKSEVISRPQAHGSFRPGFDWREAATPSVEGGFIGQSERDALQMMDTLKRAWAIGTEVELEVADAFQTTTRSVSIRFVTIPDHRGTPRFTFAIDTIAADPLRYGAETVVSTGLPVLGGGLSWPITWPLMWAAGGSDGRITLANPGTADAAPVLSVSGGLDAGFSLTEVGTGREVRFERLIPDGSVVVMDTRTGRAYIDAPGNDVTGFLTRSDWPMVPAGGSTVLQFNALGGSSGVPTLTGRTRPAYW